MKKFIKIMRALKKYHLNAEQRKDAFVIAHEDGLFI
jgi:hypothetical protein